MQHPILGEVKQSECHPFDAVAVIRHASRDIEVGIAYDDQPPETTLHLAAEVAGRVEYLDKLAKGIAVADLCDTYNSGWNEYDEVQEDGSLKLVTNPQLTKAEFEAKLSLRAINITGNQIVDFFYDEDSMFWGHRVVVSSLSGTDFCEARAELFG